MTNVKFSKQPTSHITLKKIRDSIWLLWLYNQAKLYNAYTHIHDSMAYAPASVAL